MTFQPPWAGARDTGRGLRPAHGPRVTVPSRPCCEHCNQASELHQAGMRSHPRPCAQCENDAALAAWRQYVTARRGRA